jgi:hypothetical protein
MECLSTIVNDINCERASAENCFQKILLFIYLKFNKLIFLDGEKNIFDSRNHNEDLTQEEFDYIEKAISSIVWFFQKCTSKSNLTEEEENQWDIDIINLIHKFYSCEIIPHDNRIHFKKINKPSYI